MTNHKATFCSKIFFHKELNLNGRESACCLIQPQSADIDKIRREILSGHRSKECRACWDLEDLNLESDRQIKNKSIDFYLDRDIELIEEDCRSGDFSTKILKIDISNLCNSTCVTCNSQCSTAWGTLRKSKTFKIIDQTLLDSIDYGNLVMLTFVGGEPLVDKKVFSILEDMIRMGNTTCFIDMVTNGSVELTDRQLEVLSKFKHVQLTLSIDGINKKFEYMRYPLKWNILLNNIKIFKELGINLAISYTISNINVMYYKETIDWFAQQGIPHNTNLVNVPSYFSPQCLPIEVKRQMGIPFVEPKNHTDEHDEQFRLACREIREQDKLKKIDIADYLPEFYEIIQDGKY